MFSIKFHFLIRKIRTTCTLIPTIIIDYDKEYRPCKVLRVFFRMVVLVFSNSNRLVYRMMMLKQSSCPHMIRQPQKENQMLREEVLVLRKLYVGKVIKKT